MAFKIPRVHTDDRLINQLQQNVASAIEPIFSLLWGTFVIGLSGCATTVSGLATWQKATTTSPVVLLIPLLTGTSSTTAATLTGLPSVLWPSMAQEVVLRTYDNGTLAFGVASIGVDGTITLYQSASSATFTGSGTKGVALSTITYIL